jgi:hypothetical protein
LNYKSPSFDNNLHSLKKIVGQVERTAWDNYSVHINTPVDDFPVVVGNNDCWLTPNNDLDLQEILNVELNLSHSHWG